MAERRYEFRYRAGDVASAQRMRMLQSKQTRALAAVWVISSLALAVPAIFPQAFPGSPISNWTLVVEIALIYFVTMAVMIFITPYLDFAFRRFWHLPLQYQFNDKQMRMSVVAGKSKGLRLDWREIKSANENALVFILYYGTGGKFIILPKRAFDETGLDRFRGLLKRLNQPASSLETAGKPDADSSADPFEDETLAEEVETKSSVDVVEPDRAGAPGRTSKRARQGSQRRKR